MSEQAYSTDIEIINEHIVRAVTARSILCMYNDRDKYNNFDEYYPEIIKAIKFKKNNIKKL